MIKALSEADIPLWLALAHEYDLYIQPLIADLMVFYYGFDTYMLTKIQHQEAFMAVERAKPEQCGGIIAFSRTHNRITFFGVSGQYNVEDVGVFLLQHAFSQLDLSRYITVNTLKSDAGVFRREKKLFEEVGFIEQDETVLEAGIPAHLLRLSPANTK